MKKIIFLSLFLYFAFYSQNMFAAEFNMPLAYDVNAYTFNLSDELQQIQNTPEQNKTYDFVKPENFNNNPIELDLQKYEDQKLKQMQTEKHKPAKHYTPTQPETPKWWREENSFQGWGFN